MQGLVQKELRPNTPVAPAAPPASPAKTYSQWNVGSSLEELELPPDPLDPELDPPPPEDDPPPPEDPPPPDGLFVFVDFIVTWQVAVFPFSSTL